MHAGIDLGVGNVGIVSGDIDRFTHQRGGKSGHPRPAAVQGLSSHKGHGKKNDQSHMDVQTVAAQGQVTF